MIRTPLQQKLMEKVLKKFPWVSEGALLETRNPTDNQQMLGAPKWILPDYDIWSVQSMSACVNADSWCVAEGEHHFEIIPN